MWFSSRTAPEVKVKQILYHINLWRSKQKKQHKWLDFQNKGERILLSSQVAQINKMFTIVSQTIIIGPWLSHLDAGSFAKLKDAGPFDRAGCILILIGGVLVSIYALIFTTIVINKTYHCWSQSINSTYTQHMKQCKLENNKDTVRERYSMIFDIMALLIVKETANNDDDIASQKAMQAVGIGRANTQFDGQCNFLCSPPISRSYNHQQPQNGPKKTIIANQWLS